MPRHYSGIKKKTGGGNAEASSDSGCRDGGTISQDFNPSKVKVMSSTEKKKFLNIGSDIFHNNVNFKALS